MSQVVSLSSRGDQTGFLHSVGEGFLRCAEAAVEIGQKDNHHHADLVVLDEQSRTAVEELLVAYVMAKGFVFDSFRQKTLVSGAWRPLIVARDQMVLRSLDESLAEAALGYRKPCAIALSPVAKRQELIPALGDRSMPLDLFLARLRRDEENYNPRTSSLAQMAEMETIDRHANLVHQCGAHPVFRRPSSSGRSSTTRVSQPA